MPSATMPAIAQAGGGGLSAIGSMVRGFQQQKLAGYNAANLNLQAGQTIAASQAEAQQVGLQSERQIGMARANAGASGVDVNQGSPVAATSDLAQQGALAQQLTLYRGTVQAGALQRAAAAQSYEGNQSMLGGLLTGLSTGLETYAKVAPNFAPTQPTSPSTGI